jgi:hypothetical protein
MSGMAQIVLTHANRPLVPVCICEALSKIWTLCVPVCRLLYALFWVRLRLFLACFGLKFGELRVEIALMFCFDSWVLEFRESGYGFFYFVCNFNEFLSYILFLVNQNFCSTEIFRFLWIFLFRIFILIIQSGPNNILSKNRTTEGTKRIFVTVFSNTM